MVGRWASLPEHGSRNEPVTPDDVPGLRRPGVRRQPVGEWDEATWGGEPDADLDVAEPWVCRTCGAPIPDPPPTGRRRRYCNEACWPSSYRQRAERRTRAHPTPD